MLAKAIAIIICVLFIFIAYCITRNEWQKTLATHGQSSTFCFTLISYYACFLARLNGHEFLDYFGVPFYTASKPSTTYSYLCAIVTDKSQDACVQSLLKHSNIKH